MQQNKKKREPRKSERLKVKADASTRLAYTEFCGRLQHLIIETRLIGERFASVMGACDFVRYGLPFVFVQRKIPSPFHSTLS